MKHTAILLALLAASIVSGTTPVSKTDIMPELRYILLDMHGGASALPRYAEQLERERGFSKEQMKDLLLEIADDESWSEFGRDNAVIEFIEIARPDDLPRLDPFYASTNASIRRSILSFMLERLETVPEKLTYARTRLDWLAQHPEFQSDAQSVSIGLRTVLHYEQPSESDRSLIMAFFWNVATNAVFFESAHEADMLLFRDDPAWATNEARRAMMEKWKDDPGIHEKTRALWDKALAAFNGTNAADYATAGAPGSSEADEPLMPEPAAPDSVPAFRDGAPVVPDESSEPIREPASSPFHLARIAGTTALLAALTAVIFFQRKLHRHTESKDLNSNK